jgi:hypothetical protein
MTTLQQFFLDWELRVKSGANSPMDRLETMAIEIYDRWLRERGHLSSDKPTS